MATDAPERVWRTDAPPPRYRAAITAAVVLGVAVGLVVGLQAWQRWATRAPYGPESVNAHVTMRLVPEDQAQAALDALVGPGTMNIPVGMGPLLIGQATFTVPPGASDSMFYSLFLIDQSQHQPLQQVYGGSPDGNVGQGWDGSYDQIAAQVPWLSAAARTQPSDGTTTGPGMALGWSATTHGPITFVAVPRPDTIDPAALSSYTVGLTLQNDDRSLYWAQQLAPTAP